MAEDAGGRAGAREGRAAGGGPPIPAGDGAELLLDVSGRLPGGGDLAGLLVRWVPDRAVRGEILRAVRWMRAGGLPGGRHWLWPGRSGEGFLGCRPEFDGEGHLAGIRVVHARGPAVPAALSRWLRGAEALAGRYGGAWRRAERRVRVLFDGSPDMHVLVDGRGRIRRANRAAREAGGWPVEALVGRHVARFVPSAERARLRAVARLLRASGRITDFETRVRRADGSELEVSASAVLVREDGRSPRGAHLVLRDVTRRNRLRRRLWQAERLAVTGRIAAGVAHEINNPLQAILMHLALLEDRLPRDRDARLAWNRVRRGVERIRGIVTDLLGLHREGRDAAPAPTDLHRVLFEALELVQAPLRHQGIRVRIALADDLPLVRVVEQHLYQVILNLLLNAIGAMPGGGSLDLRTRRRAGPREVELDIADSGPGIPEELLPHLFEPFPAGEDSPGTGPGLFVTRGLVHRQGGRIEVESAPGRGTTFRVFLPAGDGGEIQ